MSCPQTYLFSSGLRYTWKLLLVELDGHSNHLSNLVVDETLPNQQEAEELFTLVLDGYNFHLDDEPIGRGILRLQPPRIVMEIVASLEFLYNTLKTLKHRQTKLLSRFLATLDILQRLVHAYRYNVFIESTSCALTYIKQLSG